VTEQLRFAVLGPVQAWRGEEELPLGTPQQRAVLALLLLRDGAQASLEEIIDAIWSGRAPDSAENAVRTYISRLRAALGQGGPAKESMIARVGHGYLLRTGPESLDLAAFRDLVAKAQDAATAEDHSKAIYLLDDALGLWRGPALTASSGDFVESQRQRLSKLRVAALEAKVASLVKLGAHGDAQVILDQLVGDHPLDERFRELQMLSLYQHGRQSDALAVYRETRELLADELGVDPGQRLQSLHERVLRGDTGLLPGAGASGGPDARTKSPVRAQPTKPPTLLPANLRGFVGREAEFARAERMRPFDSDQPGRAAVVITGTAGVGKTAFAIHWAHQIADRFPDGQIYLNLRGFDPSNLALTPQAALLALFESLGESPERLPADIDRQSAHLRGLIADRKMLIILDNVHDAEQVRPLLPGGDTFVIMTSRNQLRSLTVQADAGMLQLDVLPPADAVRLLTHRLHGLSAQPDELLEIVERCGRLPLAIAIVAARIAATPQIPLAVALAELRDHQGLLDIFNDVDDAVDVRSVFSWSLQALSPQAGELFLLLSLHCGVSYDEHVAASLTGLPVPATRRLLSELVAASLIGAAGAGRYWKSHDLLCLYALELATDLPSAQRKASIRRLLDHYIATAQNAESTLNPHHRGPEPIHPQAGTAVKQFNQHGQAWAWFAVEHHSLLRTQGVAVDEGFDDYAWRLSWALETFLYRSGNWQQSLALQQAALVAASRLDDQNLEARVHRSLGRIHLHLDHYTEAREHLTRAVSYFEKAGSPEEAASGYVSLANLCSKLMDSTEAIRLYEQALQLTKDPLLRAAAGNNLGNERSAIGDDETALALCLEALELWREVGDRHGEAATLDSVGRARLKLGQQSEAVQAYRLAIAGFKDLGDNYNQASSLTNLGDCLAAANDPDKARVAWCAAVELLDEMDHPDAAGVRARLTAVDETHISDLPPAPSFDADRRQT
jgi:DNA-binding SARP family transcriptional activator/tetratricopeptide (TPR) repeat protein